MKRVEARICCYSVVMGANLQQHNIEVKRTNWISMEKRLRNAGNAKNGSEYHKKTYGKAFSWGQRKKTFTQKWAAMLSGGVECVHFVNDLMFVRILIIALWQHTCAISASL